MSYLLADPRSPAQACDRPLALEHGDTEQHKARNQPTSRRDVNPGNRTPSPKLWPRPTRHTVREDGQVGWLAGS